MRKRTHEVKIRLDDAELARLNKMATKANCNREVLLRAMLAGTTIRECPREYLEFRSIFLYLGTQLNLFEWNKSLTPAEKSKMKMLAAELWKALRQMDQTYFRDDKTRGSATGVGTANSHL